MENQQTNENSSETPIVVTGIGVGVTYQFDLAICDNKENCKEIEIYKNNHENTDDNLCFFKCCYKNLISQCEEYQKKVLDMANSIVDGSLVGLEGLADLTSEVA